LPYFQCRTRDGKVLNFLIDTDSNQNYIQPSLVENPKVNKEDFYANSIGGKITTTHHVFSKSFQSLRHTNQIFHTTHSQTFHGILGNDTMKQLNVIIDVSNDILVVNGNKRFRIKQLPAQAINNIKVRTEHMSDSQKKTKDTLTNTFRNLFADPEQKLTYATNVVGEIRTSSDTPVYTKHYPYPIALKQEVEKQIAEMLDDGIIRPSRSPYNEPV